VKALCAEAVRCVVADAFALNNSVEHHYDGGDFMNANF
jgi:hypothetical protein